jgi:trimeric autotransporter adhesin
MKIILFFILLVCSNINAQNIITTVAGNGMGGYNGDWIPATSAKLDQPRGVACDSKGNLFIADEVNARIRKVDTFGVITTIAGNGNGGFSGDSGQAVNAQLSLPQDVALDAFDNIYIVDTYNNRIRKLNTSGIIITISGTGASGFGGDGGQADTAKLNHPTGATFDALGNLYIADTYNNRVRKINTSGVITTVAGNGTAGFGGDGGHADTAKLNHPTGISLDMLGNLYIADNSNHRVRMVNTSGIITTVAGNGTAGFSGNGGQATSAELFLPADVVVDGVGNIYISDMQNNRIQMVDNSGIITTIAGNGTLMSSGDGGPATLAGLQYPIGLTFDSFGNLYIADYSADRIRKIEHMAGIENNHFNNQNPNIYPNPSTNIITIQSSKELDTIIIYNSLGEMVLQAKSKNIKEQIDIGNLPSGIYIIHTQNKYLKLIKQ